MKTCFIRLVSLIDSEKVYCGGKTERESLFIEPTILREVNFADEIMKDEIFGPILPVISFTDLELAVKEVKNMGKPLAMYVFTKNENNSDYLLNNLSFGGGCINDAVMHLANSHLPFGGVGNSGMGNYHGKFGFDCFSHQKSILKKGFSFEPLFKYPPYTSDKLNWIRRIMAIS